MLRTKFQRFLLTVTLATMMAITVIFNFSSAQSIAAPLPKYLSSPSLQLATVNRAKAAMKDVEGKTQQAVGDFTGDPKDQLLGSAKQAEAKVRNAAADIKDDLHLNGRAEAVRKNLEGKTQEAFGNLTNDPKHQMAGNAKQAESQARNLVEDVKNIFD